MDTSVGVDQVIETVAETVFQENSLIEMYEQVLTRYHSLHTLRSKKINKWYMNFTNHFFLARFVIPYVSLFTFINIKGTVSHLKIWVGGVQKYLLE